MTLLFSFPPFVSMAKELSPKLENFSAERFLNDELHLSIETNVTKQTCTVLGTLSPPDTNLFSYLALCHTLKKEGAKKCIALLPYLAYTRHEHSEPQKSKLTALMGNLFSASHIDQIITVDIHSKMAENLMTIPTISLSPAQIFAKELERINFVPDTIVSPDEGGIERCKLLAKACGISSVAYIEKQREAKGVSHFDLVGEVGKNVVIADDILDTGGTLISCLEKLQGKCQNVLIMVTHGLFTGDSWKEIWDLGVNTIYCTDTVPLKIQDDRIQKLSIIPLLKESLCNL